MTSALALALVTFGGACSTDSGGEPPTAPETPEEPAGEPRTFAMGWAVTPPRATEASVIATAQEVARHGELTLIQQSPPWTRILAGESLDALVEEPAGLSDFMKAMGSDIILLVDPLDGLDRRSEPPELVEAGRSLREPEIRELHDEWTRKALARIEPTYLGLASEINTLAAHGDPELYDLMVDMVNDLAAEARALQPGVQVFVSFQVDDAWNLLIPDGFDHFALIDDFDVDALGLSSYPVFAFDDPSDIPDDYFSVFRGHTDLPLILVEGGWSSEPSAWAGGTPEAQVEFFRTYERLMDSVNGELWVFLTFADLAIDEWGLPPDREEGLRNFARMGIVDVDFRPKPAYAEWERIRGRPLAR